MKRTTGSVTLIIRRLCVKGTECFESDIMICPSLFNKIFSKWILVFGQAEIQVERYRRYKRSMVRRLINVKVLRWPCFADWTIDNSKIDKSFFFFFLLVCKQNKDAFECHCRFWTRQQEQKKTVVYINLGKIKKCCVCVCDKADCNGKAEKRSKTRNRVVDLIVRRTSQTRFHCFNCRLSQQHHCLLTTAFRKTTLTIEKPLNHARPSYVETTIVQVNSLLVLYTGYSFIFPTLHPSFRPFH